MFAAEAALDRFLQEETGEHRRTLDALLPAVALPFGRALALCEHSVRQGGKLLLFGNGGSAADAQHLAAELVIRYQADRAAIAAIALTTDTSALTAGANDFGFERVFARQVEALGTARDVAVALSTSGRSPNVVAGLAAARERGLATCGLSGADGGTMAELCDVLLAVPSRVTARVQEMHILLGHMLCKALEQRLAGAASP